MLDQIDVARSAGTTAAIALVATCLNFRVDGIRIFSQSEAFASTAVATSVGLISTLPNRSNCTGKIAIQVCTRVEATGNWAGGTRRRVQVHTAVLLLQKLHLCLGLGLGQNLFLLLELWLLRLLLLRGDRSRRVIIGVLLLLLLLPLPLLLLHCCCLSRCCTGLLKLLSRHCRKVREIGELCNDKVSLVIERLIVLFGRRGKRL